MGIFGILGPIGDFINDKETDIYHKVTGQPTAQQNREQMNAIGDQIKAYKNQTEITNQAIQRAKTEQDVTKKAIQEKQIRALRHAFRPPGFLDQGNSSMPNKLGA